ncbi:phospholipid scramblase 2-like [Chrysoperla carnea]|uniref:phospholipid scramblase 2-like n=1 Tax=Chrysoperla carnea TaxID=189513 RepID=UPI001D062081|nr:phospholipid scramblase 2-like [Chrysoperla carnea]
MAPPITVANWMRAPRISKNCSPGLEYLTTIDLLLMHQKIELGEVLTGFETCNKYAIFNSLGQQLYDVEEETDFCTRLCFGSSRSFKMRILDNSRKVVMRLNRPFAWCLARLEVLFPNDTVIGSVQENCTLCVPSFSVNNPAGVTVAKIEGPMCTFSCCGDVKFKVMSADGSRQIGEINKQWSGLMQELFTDADNFGIKFPLDLDVNTKATLLGACILIDMIYFED